MTTLFLDPFSGISGDMVLGLLIDLGVAPAALESELRRLPVPGWQLAIRREHRRGIEGSRVEVICGEEKHHRHWSGIDALLRESDLAPPARDLARRIFRRIGEAEARVHGVPLTEVHFHEVGAVDSIVDIAGAAIGLHLLGMPRVVCAPLPLSRGMVTTAHGRYPLPAPATAEILRGCPVAADDSDFELVTPTGAAIAAEIATFDDLPPLTIDRIGYGVGGRDLDDRPNLLRGLIGEERFQGERDRVAVLETHLDDANPEWLGALLDRLLATGALDVGYTPLQMKKNRPGLRLTVVAPPAAAETLAGLIMRESSAIGVRCQEVLRYKLRRQEISVVTALGEAHLKLLFEGEAPLRAVPEYESCHRLAAASRLPLPEVYRLVARAGEDYLRQLRGEPGD